MKRIIFTNTKGGCGKTTSALSVGACLYRKGFRVLLIDLDQQGHLSKAAGAAPGAGDPTIYEILTGKASAAAAIRTTPGGYDIIPADARLTGIDILLAAKPNRNVILKNALQNVKNYDYIIMDSPANLSLAAVMGFCASDKVVLVVESRFLGLDGVAQIRDALRIVKEKYNPKLSVLGVLLTFYDTRTNLSKTIAKYAEEGFPGKVFKARISGCTALAEAPGAGRDIFTYKRKSTAAAQYEAVTDEIIAKTQRKRKGSIE